MPPGIQAAKLGVLDAYVGFEGSVTAVELATNSSRGQVLGVLRGGVGRVEQWVTPPASARDLARKPGPHRGIRGCG